MTRLDVKVGDKVRVVNPWGTQGQYKKGDVLTVRMVAASGIAVEETYRVLLHDEYELYEPIKVGDTVTLIDKPWETDVWKGMDRFYKKYFMKLKGTIWTVEKIRIGYFNSNYDCDDSQNGCPFIVPLELLRKVEDGINAEWIATGMDEPKKGDLFRVIGDKGTWNVFDIGDEVTFSGRINNDDFECQRGKHITQWVSPCDLAPALHRHTPEQVAEAQRIIGEIVAGFRFGQCYYIRDESGKDLTIRYTAEIADGMHTITAHCSPHDEYNRTIGLLVALCKATGRKLPDWL